MRIRVPDVTLRLLSLALALLLWFAVAGEKSAEVSVAAPIEFRNLPNGLELVGPVPRAIDIWLRGSPGILQRVKPGDVYVSLDVAGTGPGPFTVHVALRDVRAPAGLRIAAIRPASLTLTLDRSAERVLPVKPQVLGQPAPGYRVTDVTSEPSEVRVVGPAALVAALNGIATEPVSVEQAQTGFAREASLTLPDEAVRLVDPHRVRVTVRVEPH